MHSPGWHAACEAKPKINSWNIQHESDRLVKLQNRLVNFRVCDVHFPEPERLLVELFGQHLLQGRVTGATCDSAGGEFAIVEIEGVDKPVFVPLDHILGVV